MRYKRYVFLRPDEPMNQHGLQCFTLKRFIRMTELYQAREATWSDAEQGLMQHALHSTFRDCQNVGLGDVACVLMAELLQGG